MPKKMERALKKEAVKRGFKGADADRYVYGAMRNRGWTPSKKGKK